MGVALAVLAGAVPLGSVVPPPARTGIRVTPASLLALAPVCGLVAALPALHRRTFATFPALLPVGFAWLCFLDLRWGVSPRMSRFPGRARRGDGNGGIGL